MTTTGGLGVDFHRLSTGGASRTCCDDGWVLVESDHGGPGTVAPCPLHRAAIHAAWERGLLASQAENGYQPILRASEIVKGDGPGGARQDTPRGFEAKYSGTCQVCRAHFDAGDALTLVDGRPAHYECPGDDM